MSSPSQEPIPRSRLTRVVISSIARTAAGCGLIWFALAMVPERPDLSLAVPIVLVFAGLGIYGWFFARELKRIRTAKYPMVVAGEAMILVAVMFLAVFAAYYVMISNQNPGAFTEPLDHFTAYYYALTVLATVGFGDITPVEPFARVVTMLQMAIDIVFIAAVVKVITVTAQNTQRLRAEGQQGRSDDRSSDD